MNAKKLSFTLEWVVRKQSLDYTKRTAVTTFPLKVIKLSLTHFNKSQFCKLLYQLINVCFV